MRILPGKDLVIVGALLLLTFIQIHPASTHSRVSRQAQNDKSSEESGGMSNDLDLTSIKNFLDMFPVIGPFADVIFDYVSEAYLNLDHLSNGVISRLLGGSLPCLLTDTKLTCSGTSKNGGTYGAFKNIIDMLPDTILPDTAKEVVLDFIRMIIIPVANTLFGGVPA